MCVKVQQKSRGGVHRCQCKGATRPLPVTWPDTERLLKFCQHQTQQYIRSKDINKDPSTS